MKKIKEAVGGRILRSEVEPLRLRQGYNFNSATHVGFIYLDSDQAFFEHLKEYAHFLKENFDIKRVQLMAYVDQPEKKLSSWQQQLQDLHFFTKQQVNWHLKPQSGIEKFVNEEFDILIDFSGGNVLPLNFVLKESRARMKVGLRGTRAERYCDFILNMGNQFGVEKFVEQLNSYLSNSKIR